MFQKSRCADDAILQKIRDNNLKGWEELYEAYAAPMLGIICKFTNNKKKAEEILVKIFTGKVFEEFLKNNTAGLPGPLYRYTFKTTIAILEAEGIPVDAGIIKGLPGIFKVVQHEQQDHKVFPALRSSTPFSWLPFCGVNVSTALLNYS